MPICSLCDIQNYNNGCVSTDCMGNNSIIKKPHIVCHGEHDQIFQALSLFFCRRGAWVQGYILSAGINLMKIQWLLDNLSLVWFPGSPPGHRREPGNKVTLLWMCAYAEKSQAIIDLPARPILLLAHIHGSNLYIIAQINIHS